MGMNSCNDKHVQVAYEGKECPVCQLRYQLDELSDAKTDIEEQNIFELFNEVKEMHKRIKTIEEHIGLQNRRGLLPHRNVINDY